MTNRNRLRAHLKRLGWSQRRLADWLTQRGDNVSTRTVERWLGGQSRCPVWPSLMLELWSCRQHDQQGKSE